MLEALSESATGAGWGLPTTLDIEGLLRALLARLDAGGGVGLYLLGAMGVLLLLGLLLGLWVWWAQRAELRAPPPTAKHFRAASEPPAEPSRAPARGSPLAAAHPRDPSAAPPPDVQDVEASVVGAALPSPAAPPQALLVPSMQPALEEALVVDVDAEPRPTTPPTSTLRGLPPLARARALLEAGRREEAIGLLMALIDNDPDADQAPWRLLYQAMDAEAQGLDLETFADRYARRVGIRPAGGEATTPPPAQPAPTPTADPTAAPLPPAPCALEARLPRILEAIAACWPDTQCLGYLDSLLVDAHGAPRQGFAAEVTDELRRGGLGTPKRHSGGERIGQVADRG
jgi:hypothetical protein